MKVLWIVLAAAALAVASGDEGVIDFTEAIQTLEQLHAQIGAHLERYAREAMESFHASQAGKESASETLERYARKSQESIHASQTGKDWDAWISVSEEARCKMMYNANCLHATAEETGLKLHYIDSPTCEALQICPTDFRKILAEREASWEALTETQARFDEATKHFDAQGSSRKAQALAHAHMPEQQRADVTSGNTPTDRYDTDAWISVSQAAWCITMYRAECLYASGDAELRQLDTPQCRLLLWCPPDLNTIFAKWEDPQQQELTAAQTRILELAKAP